MSFIKAKEQQAEAFARQQNQELDPALKNYFSLVKAGRLGESQELFQNMRSSTIQKSAWLIWQIVIDAVLAVDAVGNNEPEVVMSTAREMTSSLPPGCIYFGGTIRDAACRRCFAPRRAIHILSTVKMPLCDCITWKFCALNTVPASNYPPPTKSSVAMTITMQMRNAAQN